MSFLTIKKDVKIEFTEKKSVFIGHAFFVSDEEQALEKLDLVAREHGQATHNVYAYSLRKHVAATRENRRERRECPF